jgi:hypothetical protein
MLSNYYNLLAISQNKIDIKLANNGLYEINNFKCYSTRKPKKCNLINIEGDYTHSIQLNNKLSRQSSVYFSKRENLRLQYNSLQGKKNEKILDFYCEIRIIYPIKRTIKIGHTYEPLHFPKCIPEKNKYITVMEIYAISNHSKYKSIILTVVSNDIIQHIELKDILYEKVNKKKKFKYI